MVAGLGSICQFGGCVSRSGWTLRAVLQHKVTSSSRHGSAAGETPPEYGKRKKFIR
jgi:hypothetical protein